MSNVVKSSFIPWRAMILDGFQLLNFKSSDALIAAYVDVMTAAKLTILLSLSIAESLNFLF